MPLRDKQLNEVIEDDLQTLKDNKEIENKTIEYKWDLPVKDDGNRKFLASVSSFANALGGDLIYGIRAEEGMPVEVSGIPSMTEKEVDGAKLRLENLIRDGIEPRIFGINIHHITLQSSGIVIIIRIPRSYALPHMVTYNKDFRFYVRSSAGRQLMDVSEVRTTISLSETTAERIRNFRRERLGMVISGLTPAPLIGTTKIVLHIIPFSAFDLTTLFSVSVLAQYQRSLEPLNSNGWSHRYNFDGLLAYEPPGYQESYTQLFRNGIIEAARAYTARPREDGALVMPHVTLEEGLLRALPLYLRIQRNLGIHPPLFVMLSVMGVSGHRILHRDSGFSSNEIHPIDRDELVIPETLIDTFDCDPTQVMRPLFDTIWNASGWPRSMNYDNMGNRVNR